MFIRKNNVSKFQFELLITSEIINKYKYVGNYIYSERYQLTYSIIHTYNYKKSITQKFHRMAQL